MHVVSLSLFICYHQCYLIGPVKAAGSGSMQLPVQESLGQATTPDLVTLEDIPDFVKLIRMNSKKWSKLAVRLKVPMKKISEIRSKYRMHDEACTVMLQTWITEKTNPLTKTDLESLILGL